MHALTPLLQAQSKQLDPSLFATAEEVEKALELEDELEEERRRAWEEDQLNDPNEYWPDLDASINPFK